MRPLRSSTFRQNSTPRLRQHRWFAIAIANVKHRPLIHGNRAFSCCNSFWTITRWVGNSWSIYFMVHNKKLSYCLQTARRESLPKIANIPWLRPRLNFTQNFHGLSFRSNLWICVQNLKCVALPVPGITWGSSKDVGSLWLCPRSLFPRISYRPFIQTISVGNFWLELRTSNSMARGRKCYRLKGRWWVPVGPP